MRRMAWWVLAIALLLAAMAGVVWAQTGYELGRYSAEHSGAVATGGSYTLVAATGQADAGDMTGAGFSLAGGFLTGAPVAAEPLRELYLPRVGR